MSETSSDTESSCGWTIISNEGSDIETLGSEAAVEYGAEVLERPPVGETKLQGAQAPACAAEFVEERTADSLADTEQTVDVTLFPSEDGSCTTGIEHVCVLSSSDHSDIVTLGDSKEHAEEEEGAGEELCLGTPYSSQYTFTAAETVLPAQQPAVTTSSSSEDEAGRSTVVRRRRLRKNTTGTVMEPEEEELDSGQSEKMVEEEDEEQQEDLREIRPAAALSVENEQSSSSSLLNKCILIALIVAVSMGFHGTVEILQRQKTVEKISENLLHQHVKERALANQNLDDLDDHAVISLLTEVIDKLKKENQELHVSQAQIQAQRDDLETILRQKCEEKTDIISQQQRSSTENEPLKSSLQREEESLSTLQEELRHLRSQLRELEAIGPGADKLLAENQRLKDQLEEEKQLTRSIQDQREDMMAEAQTLMRKLDMERQIRDELQTEMDLLRSQIPRAEKEASSEAEELQSRLTELERRLSFEQQRSDLWERLYLETKEERAKGDTESKVKKPRAGMSGKVKETFDAVKNSTKEFVHHHKEQIKKAKEAVKENLRKFSDSVKLTFRNFKDSASTLFNKAKDLYDKKRDKKKTNVWQHTQPHRRASHRPNDSFQSNQNTRKYGAKVHEDQSAHKPNLKGCAGVFDCAYRESMSLFNTAMEPVRADEFHQLLQSYLQQEVHHFHHWKDLEVFISSFFHNGVFIHDQMLFTDFVSGVEDYLTDMSEYHGLDDDVFRDLDDYVYRHFFGEVYAKNSHPNGPFERPDSKEPRLKHHQRKLQRSRSRPQRERKWSKSGRNTDRNIADVKIELGPMPFDPKY